MRLKNIECKVFRERWLIAEFMIFTDGTLVGEKELDIYAGDSKERVLADLEAEKLVPVELFGNLLVFHSIEESVETGDLCVLTSTLAGLARMNAPKGEGSEFFRGLSIGYKYASMQVAREYIEKNRREMRRAMYSREKGEW